MLKFKLYMVVGVVFLLSTQLIAATKTVTITANSVKGIVKKSSDNPSNNGYFNSPPRAGYDQYGSIIDLTFTQEWYNTLYNFSYSGFSPSDIVSVKVNYSVINFGTTPADILISSPMSTCTGTLEEIYDCSNDNTYVVDIKYDITSAYTGSKTINSNSTPPLSPIFDTNNITIVLSGWQQYNGLVHISDVWLEITYNCDEPVAPTIGAVTNVTSSSAQVNWATVPGATSYEVYNCTGSLVATSTTTSATVNGLQPNQQYSYKVRAVNDCAPSAFSSCASVTTLPQTPTGFNVDAQSSSQVSLTWNSVPGAFYYEVYNCSNGLIETTPTNSLIINGLSPGTSYSYKVRTVIGTNKSVYTSCKSDVTVPALVTGFSGSPVSSSLINLTWDAMQGATYYHVYSCDGNTLYASVNDPELLASGFDPLTTYSFKVRAGNSAGAASFTSCINVTTTMEEPKNVMVTSASETQLSLSWDNISGATSFGVYDCNNNLLNTVTSPLITINGLTSGSAYCFKINATDGTNVSNFTTYNTVTVPSAPAITSTTALSSTEINLEWTADPEVTSYSIYNCTGTLLGTSNPDNFTVGGLQPQTSYSFKVTAENVNGVSQFSTCQNGLTLMAAPQNLTIDDETLSWDAVTGATSYDVALCDGTVLTNISSLSTDVSSYLSGSGEYCFKVKGRNNNNESDYSSSVSYIRPYEAPPEIWIEYDEYNYMDIYWTNTIPISPRIEGYKIYHCDGSDIHDRSCLSISDTENCSDGFAISGGHSGPIYGPLTFTKRDDAYSHWQGSNRKGHGYYIKVQAIDITNPLLNSEFSKCAVKFRDQSSCQSTNLNNYTQNSPDVRSYKNQNFDVQNIVINEYAAFKAEAEDYIVIKPGSHFKAASYVELSIEPCAVSTSKEQSAQLNEIGSSTIEMYPNPTTGVLNFNQEVSGEIMIYTSVGDLVLIKELDLSRFIDLSHLKDGVYVIKILQPEGGSLTNQKIVLMK